MSFSTQIFYDRANSNSSYFGLGEGCAYYMKNVFTDRKYGANSPSFGEQGIGYTNNSPVAGLSSNLNLLEDFSPLRTNDPFAWIPQGLFYDLIDNMNDFNAVPQRVSLVDNVSGYTNQQFFNALDNDITTLQQYKVRLLSNTNNNQAANVNSIFTFYGY